MRGCGTRWCLAHGGKLDRVTPQCDTGPVIRPGQLLVSTPALVDPNFVHSVVLLIEHDDDAGSLGVVLNRPTGVGLGEAVPEWADVGDAGSEIFGGGPVEPQVALALGQVRPGAPVDEPTLADPADHDHPVLVDVGVEVVDLDGDPVLAAARYGVIRVYSGYSGWGPGQLTAELDEGAWFVVDGTADDIFTSEPSELWRHVLGRQPGDLARLRHFPDDVDLN